MNGLVNRALEDLVRERAGAEAWEDVKARAGVDMELFVRQKAYPDSLTQALMAGAGERLGLAPAELLREFGIHWVLRTASQEYPDLMASAGGTLDEFLANLPNLHTRLGLLFPNARLPEFRCAEDALDPPGAPGLRRFRIRYRASRPGLTAFAEGMLQGLGRRFGVPVTVQHLGPISGQDEEFLLAWNPS